MAVKREIGKMMKLSVSLKCLWILVGIIIMGGVYLLSYNNVDEMAVNETTRLVYYLRAVLTK